MRMACGQPPALLSLSLAAHSQATSLLGNPAAPASSCLSPNSRQRNLGRPGHKFACLRSAQPKQTPQMRPTGSTSHPLTWHSNPSSLSMHSCPSSLSRHSRHSRCHQHSLASQCRPVELYLGSCTSLSRLPGLQRLRHSPAHRPAGASQSRRTITGTHSGMHACMDCSGMMCRRGQCLSC